MDIIEYYFSYWEWYFKRIIIELGIRESVLKCPQDSFKGRLNVYWTLIAWL